MTLRPEIEALVQGALDGSLSPEDRQTLDQLMASDPSVRARAGELEQLLALLQSVRQVDAPPTFAADVLARIHASSESHDRVVEFSRGSKPGKNSAVRGGASMNKNIIWGLAAAAVLVLAVVGYMANPSVNQGTEATIGTAQRYQAPQIEAKDVAVGDTSVQALLQSDTWDAIVKDETLRTLLQDASFRKSLLDPEMRKSLRDPDLLRSLSSQAVARALADPDMVKRFADPEFARKLSDPELKKKLMDPEYAKKLNDPELNKKLNDAELIKRLVDSDLRVMFRHDAVIRAMSDANVRAKLASADIVAALARPGLQAALMDPGFATAMAHPRFAEAMGVNLNSPIVDGAVIK